MVKIEDPDLHKTYFVLKNKKRIYDQNKLTEVEKAIAVNSSKKIFRDKYFECSPDYVRYIHKILFGDLYYFAGKYRTIHVEKNEELLQGYSIEYDEPQYIEKDMNKLFKVMNETKFYDVSNTEQASFITRSIAELWQIHPFREGNTRTSLVFLRKWLKDYGITYSDDVFANINNYKYYRDALVAACFESEELCVGRNYTYLYKMITDLMSEAKYSEEYTKKLTYKF